VYPQNHRGNGCLTCERCCWGGRRSNERCCWSGRRSSQRCCWSERLSNERCCWSGRRRRERHGRRLRPKQRFDAVKRKRAQQQKKHAHDNARHGVHRLFGWLRRSELRATFRAHGIDTFSKVNHLFTVRLLAVPDIGASISGGHKLRRFQHMQCLSRGAFEALADRIFKVATSVAARHKNNAVKYLG
jgi:hypothetical protein